MVDARADLLVGGEADADLTVFDIRVPGEVSEREHDLGDAGLVVGPEEGRPVGRDEVLAEVVIEFREHPGLKERVVPVVFFDDARLHILARDGGRGVHVGDEAEHLPVSREPAVDVAVVLVVVYVLGAEGRELLIEDLREVVLGGCRGAGSGLLRGGCLDFYVSHEAVKEVIKVIRHNPFVLLSSVLLTILTGFARDFNV